MQNSKGSICYTLNLNLPANIIKCAGNSDNADNKGQRQIASSSNYKSTSNDINTNDILNLDTRRSELSKNHDDMNQKPHGSKHRTELRDVKQAQGGNQGATTCNTSKKFQPDLHINKNNTSHNIDKHKMSNGSVCYDSDLDLELPANLIYCVGDDGFTRAKETRRQAKVSNNIATNSELITNAIHNSDLRKSELSKSEGERAKEKEMRSVDETSSNNITNTELNTIKFQNPDPKEPEFNMNQIISGTYNQPDPSKHSEQKPIANNQSKGFCKVPDNENRSKSGMGKDTGEQIQREEFVREKAECRRHFDPG